MKEDLDHKPSINIVDQTVADVLLRDLDASLAARDFIAHMSYALRQGHLCVTQSFPKPSELWGQQETEEKPLSLADWALWDAHIAEGSRQLPKELIGKSIIKDDDRYYFQKYWEEETELLNHCERLMSHTSTLAIDATKLQEQLKHADLLPEQLQAVTMAINHPFSILAGGPGTGKTHTVGVLLKILWNCLTEAQRNDFKIGVAAPTGKAAAQLQSSLGRSLSGTDWQKNLSAKTLHSLLGSGPLWRDRPPRLAFNLLIVDESSMIDAKLMGRLLKSVPSGTHLLLVGDPDQLPSIDAGSIFSDLIEALKIKGCYSHLKTCLRSELAGILSFAQAVNAGDASRAFTELNQEGLEYEERAFHYKDLEALQKKYGSHFDYSDDLRQALDAQKKFCILTPLRRGLFGVEKMNSYFHERKKTAFVPIMITGNAPEIDLFNGKLGLMHENDTASFLESDGTIRTLSTLLLPKYELAYSISVHKSQGSEFEQVLLALPPAAEVFGRKVLYTGITRARKKVIIWSHGEMMRKIIEFSPQRVSGLTTRLKKRMECSC